MDILTKEQRSYNMSRIRGKDTTPEIRLRKNLWNLGLRYRIHYKLPGRPDIVFPGRKLVVFVDGCFWHGCPKHGVRPKTNSSFWNKKIQGNIERDTRIKQELEDMGWTVLRFWEHDIASNLSKIIKKLANVVIESKRKHE
ncbi:MAG TPA: very short patch repair endonuclease [Mucilaginibacter sp.]